MTEQKRASIEQKLIEVLRSKNGQPKAADQLISRARQELQADEWDVRKVLWRLTADGLAEFSPGFKAVSLRRS